MRQLFFVLAPVAMIALTTPASALEKTSARMIDRPEDWSASTTGTIRYYNNCTGWVWVWSGWAPGEQLGVNFDTGPCTTPPVLNASWALTFSGVPSGYGFTGTIAAVGGQDCAAPVVASQPYLPPVADGWNATVWGGVTVPESFSILVTWQAMTGFTNDTGLASDHPFAGATGPAACGTCFPTTRVVASRYYGVGGAYCPSGTTLSDGLCDIEFMIDVNVKCVTSVESLSWGQIKNIYR
jgi:hypothetical protein